MKKLNYYLLPYLFLWLMACQTSSTDDNATTKDSLQTAAPDTSNLAISDDIDASFSAIKHFADYTEDFQALVISLDGIFRGVSLGMAKDVVKKVELAELVKETNDVLVYKTEIGKNESLTVNYKFKDGQVNGIFASVKVDNNEAYEALNAELIDYYNNKLGEVKMEGEQETWFVGNTHKLTVKDIVKNKEYFIEIELK